jgi:hypothetical protein
MGSLTVTLTRAMERRQRKSAAGIPAPAGGHRKQVGDARHRKPLDKVLEHATHDCLDGADWLELSDLCAPVLPVRREAHVRANLLPMRSTAGRTGHVGQVLDIAAALDRMRGAAVPDRADLFADIDSMQPDRLPSTSSPTRRCASATRHPCAAQRDPRRVGVLLPDARRRPP